MKCSMAEHKKGPYITKDNIIIKHQRNICDFITPNATGDAQNPSRSWEKMICMDSDVDADYFNICMGDSGGKSTI